LIPKPGKKPQRLNNSLQREMWRTASSMELIPSANRVQLGDALLKQGKESGFNDVTLWCLSRLGARQLFYGPANLVLPPSVASRWIETLLPVPKAQDALIALVRKTGDPTRDVPPAVYEAVKAKVPEIESERDERALGRIYGEELPSGLILGVA
jgi:hypothetical protein